MANLHHAIDYIEFNVTDLPATKAFYEAAFGWRFNDYGPEYAGIVGPDGDGEVGGMNATGSGRGAGRAGALVLLYSDNLDGTLASVRRRAARSSRSRTSSRAGAGSTSPTRAATSSASGRPPRGRS